MVNHIIFYRGRSPSKEYYSNSEDEGRGFNARFPHFRVGKINATTIKCVPNLKHNQIFPEVGKCSIFHVKKWHRSCRIFIFTGHNARIN